MSNHLELKNEEEKRSNISSVKQGYVNRRSGKGTEVHSS